MTNAITKFLLLALGLIILSGCVTQKIEKQKKADSLEWTLYQFAKTIRWAYFDEAYSFRKYEKGEYPQPPKSLAQIRVTSYDVLHPPTLMVEDVAVQLVEIKYVFVDSQRVRTLRDKQIWIYDKDDKRWYLDSPIPDFK